MTLEFSFEDKVKCLEKIGYRIELEDTVEFVKHYYHEEEVPRKVWVVRYKGESVSEWAGLGARRVDFVFEQEVRRRLIGLLF